jgi:hypothetical protein
LLAQAGITNQFRPFRQGLAGAELFGDLKLSFSSKKSENFSSEIFFRLDILQIMIALFPKYVL